MKSKISLAIVLIGMIQLNLIAQTDLVRITTGDITNSFQETHGASFIDYNNDGFLDIYVPTGLDIVGMVEIPNILYRNNQDGTFSKIASHETINLSTASFSGAKWGDIDNNRLIDLFIPDIYADPYKLLIKQRNDSTFITSSLFNIYDPTNVRDAGFLDYNNDGLIDIIIVGADDILFYSNNGDDTFTETQHDENSGHGGTSISYSDFDYDGDLDLFIVEFALGKNRLFYNSSGTFIESDTSIITRDSVLSNSSAWGDYNNDGYVDLFVANNGVNYLYKNLWNSHFEQISTGSIVNDIENSISCNWADIDNDGDLDLFVGNNSGYNNSIYLNNGDETFNKVISGDVIDENSSYCSKGVWGDYDNDGDLDLYVSNYGDDGRNFLYQNTTLNKNWIKIKLEGYISNYSSIGAKVKIKANSKWQFREISGNNSRHCQNDLIVHFGIDTETSIDSIIVDWPSGVTQYMLDVNPNQLVTIQEASFDINDFVCTPDTILIKALAFSPDNSDWSISGGNIVYNGGDSLVVAFVETVSTARIRLINNGDVYSEKTVELSQVPTSSFIIDTNKLCGADTVLISYTGTGTENANYSWNFSGGNIISGAGQGDYQINWTSAGIKNISLSVEENGCTPVVSSQQLKVYQPNSSFSLDNVVCEYQNTSISFNGIASDSASFDWDFNGANIVSQNNEDYLVNWENLGVKNVSLIINDNGCVSSQIIQSIEHNPIPTPTFTAPEKVCYNGIANIEYLGTATSSANYNWNFNNGSILSGTGEGPYEITWGNSGIKSVSLIVTENGCSSDTNLVLSVNQQTQPISICMVSIDSSNHYMIVWEQPVNNSYDSIIIYKETFQSDVYEKIGSHSARNKTVFIDENSNPAQNSSRYKISVLDTCGYETSESDYHKTMHLTINSGINGAWNLIWDGYEGFSYSTYNIYRGTSDGNMLKIAEQASNTFTYTDLTPPVGTVYYQIEIENPNSCNISNLKSSNNYYGSTRSNIVNSSQVNSIDDFSLEGVEIYPNPANDKLYIKTIAKENYNIEIFSLDGKLMVSYQNMQNNGELDISPLKPGLYLIKLTNIKKSINMRLIKR